MIKLYVWNNPYQVSYGGTCAYAIAESEDQAREIVSRSGVARYGYAPDGMAREVEVTGPPDRVHDLPYGEIYYWAE